MKQTEHSTNTGVIQACLEFLTEDSNIQIGLTLEGDRKQSGFQSQWWERGHFEEWGHKMSRKTVVLNIKKDFNIELLKVKLFRIW